MRRTGLLLAAAAVLVTGLSTAPARAYDGWYGQGGYGWHDDSWRERAWRWHEWREQAWRRHLWREQHRWYPGSYQGYYAPRTHYDAPTSAYGYR